jgi:hypothetical protein
MGRHEPYCKQQPLPVEACVAFEPAGNERITVNLLRSRRGRQEQRSKGRDSAEPPQAGSSRITQGTCRHVMP